MRIGLISDTHGQLRPQIFEHFQDVEHILHAGDVGDPSILTELAALAPVHAVVGNTDGPPLCDTLDDVQALELQGRIIVLTHGHLLGSPTAERLQRAHPQAHVIVYGHTHKAQVRRVNGTLVVNPGAAGPARFRVKPTIAILELKDGAKEVVRLIGL